MGRISGVNSVPQIQTFSGKFCLPTPVVMSGVYSTTGHTASVTSITMDGSGGAFAVVVTAAAHNLRTGDLVTISGADQAAYNGNFKVTVLTTTTFKIFVKVGTTSPATGTVIFAPTAQPGCEAVGTGTSAGSEFQVGDWLYDPLQDAVRQVSVIHDSTHWSFAKNFPANVSGATVQLSARGVYRGVSVQNTGSASGVLMGVTLTPNTPIATYEDEEGLDPVCGDATATTFFIGLQSKASL